MPSDRLGGLAQAGFGGSYSQPCGEPGEREVVMTMVVSAPAGGRAAGLGLAEWAERTASRRDPRSPGGRLRFAFYGRVSTEDHQDPVTSRARQRDQAAMLVAGQGRSWPSTSTPGRAGCCRASAARRQRCC